MAKAANTLTYSDLQKSILGGRMAPIYILYGEEGYYIDRLLDTFEQTVPEAARDFNLYTLYGPETNAATVHEVCQRYPMMSDRQVVILKEAQSMDAREVDKLARYAAAPSPTTTLVVAFRGVDKPKGAEFMKTAKKSGATLFESAKVTERSLGTVIAGIAREKRLGIDPAAITLLRDHVGLDISRLYNEIDKLAVALPTGTVVDATHIAALVGINKDYNNTELLNALTARNARQALTIVRYFRANPKNNPVQVTLTVLFNHYSDLLIYHYGRGKSPAELAADLGKPEWALRRLGAAATTYNAFQCFEIVSAIRRADAESKGVGSRQNPYDILHDLVYHILTAKGTIPTS